MWCDLFGMKFYASKIKTMIVSGSCTIHPQSTPMSLDGTLLEVSGDLVLFGVTFDAKMTFEKHLFCVSRAVAQRLGIMRKFWQGFHDRSLLLLFFVFMQLHLVKLDLGTFFCSQTGELLIYCVCLCAVPIVSVVVAEGGQLLIYCVCLCAVPVVSVVAAEGGEARLPCDVTPPTSQDSPILILIARGNTPLYR